jgi:hypothetical protein
MSWLTWRQFRIQAVFGYAAAAVVVVLLATTGPELARQYQADPGTFLNDLSGPDRFLYLLATLVVLAVPVLIGMFWGAPLVARELDSGTYQLAWTQTTRTRWLASKLCLIGLASMALTGLLSLAVTWWASPIDVAISNTRGLPAPGLLVFPRLSREVFDSRGLVPVGYAAFAFLLAVTIGIITRRTLTTIAVFLALFVITQVAVAVVVRPAILAPVQTSTTITAANLLNLNVNNSLTVIPSEPGAWVVTQHTVNAAGQPAHAPASVIRCLLKPSGPAGLRPCLARLAALGYRQRISYQPSSRFWPLQWAETVSYLTLTLLVAGLALWRIRSVT